MTLPDPAQEMELRSLAGTYARGVDRRDADLFASVFTEDARLQVLPGSLSAAPINEFAGIDELRGIPARLARYEKTFHFVGSALYELDGASATGDVYCIAQHLLDAQNVVMMIRYHDDYRQVDGKWLISFRRVLVDWQETHAVAAPA